MAGRMSRDKGKRGESEVRKVLQAVLNAAWREAYTQKYHVDGSEQLALIQAKGFLLVQRNTLQSDKGGCDLVGVPDFAIEVKFVERKQIARWEQQTWEQTPVGYIPMLWYRSNKEPWKIRCGPRRESFQQEKPTFVEANYAEIVICMRAYLIDYYSKQV